MTGLLLGAATSANPTRDTLTAFNAKIAPRSLDLILAFASLDGALLWSSLQRDAKELGATIVLAWQPTGPLSDVLDGRYDQRLLAAAQACRWHGDPVIIRLAHEFNGTWYPYGAGHETPEQYIAGWRHVVELFRKAGATNARWCWCPNVWVDDARDPRAFFPGDDVVDVVALDGYMTRMLKPTTFRQLFRANYDALMAQSTRPFMVGEVGCEDDPRVDRARWIADMWSTVREVMPRLVALNWWDRDLCTLDATALAAFQRGVNAHPFVGDRRLTWPSL